LGNGKEKPGYLRRKENRGESKELGSLGKIMEGNEDEDMMMRESARREERVNKGRVLCTQPSGQTSGRRKGESPITN